jgi:hypothetical protein
LKGLPPTLIAQLYALYNASGESGADFSGIINMIRGKSENKKVLFHTRTVLPHVPIKSFGLRIRRAIS